MNEITARWKITLKVLSRVLVLIFLLMLVVFIVGSFLTSRFIPSDKLLHLSKYVSVWYGIVLTAAVAPSIASRIYSDQEHRFKLVTVLVFLPLFTAATMHMAIVHEFGYVLHRLEPPVPAEEADRVTHAIASLKAPCRNRAYLEGGDFLTPKWVCGISTNAVTALNGGGEIKLYGTKSSYGFEVERYSYRQGTSAIGQ